MREHVPQVAQSPRITIRNVSKTYRTRLGNVAALNSVSLDVEAGELVVLLGPSGCGKTTLLRCVAGLERPDEGEISIHGNIVYSSQLRVFQPAERRRVSMVFQSYALWPHMTVFDNVAYALRNRKTPRPEIEGRVEAVLAMVDLGGKAQSFPGQLSGGQQQRVALARAIVTNDGVVLFDEPLSNVDAKVRGRLRLELLELHRDLRFSALYVTHDQTEASSMADRIAVMDRASIAQIGPPREVYNQPLSRYVADFIGSANQLAGEIETLAEDGCTVKTSVGLVRGIPSSDNAASFARGQNVVVMFRPEHLRISGDRSAIANSWAGVVRQVMFFGSYVEYVVSVGDSSFLVRSMEAEAAGEGDAVWLVIDPARVRILEQSPE